MNAAQPTLTGKTILITRSAKQAEAIATKIRERGGEAFFLPCLEVECLPENSLQSVSILENPNVELLFTSRNGVECVASALGGEFTSIIGNRRVAAVGNNTAAALIRHGIQPTLVPQTASQQGLLEAYRERGIPQQLLFFRAEEGNDLLQRSLTKHACEITTLYPYRMKCPESDASKILEKLEHQEIDGLILGSSKTVENYIKRVGTIEAANSPAVVVISPQVAKVAEDAGLSVQAVAKTASFDAMLDALSNYFDNSGA